MGWVGISVHAEERADGNKLVLLESRSGGQGGWSVMVSGKRKRGEMRLDRVQTSVIGVGSLCVHTYMLLK